MRSSPTLLPATAHFSPEATTVGSFVCIFSRILYMCIYRQTQMSFFHFPCYILFLHFAFCTLYLSDLYIPVYRVYSFFLNDCLVFHCPSRISRFHFLISHFSTILPLRNFLKIVFSLSYTKHVAACHFTPGPGYLQGKSL